MFFELLKSIIPSILTGIIGFAIAKINRNIPLDKLEITYNRVYYPLYKLIKEFDDVGEIDHVKLQTLYKLLRLKYDKYMSPSTKYLSKCYIESFYLNKNINKKDYQRLHDNIVQTNSYIRYKLGYLTTSYFDAYKIMPLDHKLLIIDCFLICIVYLLITIFTVLPYSGIKNFAILISIITILLGFLAAIINIKDFFSNKKGR